MGFAAGDTLEYAWTTATDAPLIEFAEPWAAVFGWLGFVATALVPLAFLVGTLRMRSMAGPLAPFAAEVAKSGSGAGLGDALRAALGDPSLELVRSVPGGGWASETGRPVDHLEPGGGRAVTSVGSGEPPLAALVHDPALRDQPELLDAVVTVLRLALENERLEAEVREQLRAVTESRARIVGAVEQERRRLERDLHDGAQQRLVAVALRLQEARSAVEAATVPDELRRRLDAIAEELGIATHELREFARGIHPAILTDEGIGPAVASLARRSTIPVDVLVELEGRLPMAIESTAYFTVAEALTNAQRYSQANLATVRVTAGEGAVRIEIADDGLGGADPALGSGLRGLADRVTALGGAFVVDSERGHGTRIRAAIPVP
jgi:signal transduction histidine kinase